MAILTAPTPPVLHATTVACRRDGTWRGVLIQGASGEGKSDLALRLMERGWRLVADDRTVAWVSGGRLFGRAPDVLAGLVEARGIGVRPVPVLGYSEIALAAVFGAVERTPEPQTALVRGVSLPLIRLAPLEASAPAKLALAVAMLRL